MTVRFSMMFVCVILAGCVGAPGGGGGGDYVPPLDLNSAERLSPEGAPQCEKPASWVCPAFLPWDETVPLYLVRKWGDFRDPVYTIADEPAPDGLELTDEWCSPLSEAREELDVAHSDAALWITQDRGTALGRGERRYEAAYKATVTYWVQCMSGNEWAYQYTARIDGGDRLWREEWPQYGPTAGQ